MAAVTLWQRAVEYSLAYRRDGGESQDPAAELCTDIANALRQGDTAAVTQRLAQLTADPDLPPQRQVLLAKLHAILHGDRTPALADDPALYYDDAAELHRLLETLAKPSRHQRPCLHHGRSVQCQGDLPPFPYLPSQQQARAIPQLHRASTVACGLPPWDKSCIIIPRHPSLLFRCAL